ncbi:MAG: cache domain-containing protein [Desulfatibacillum sp.]|nr:cache domain-containing protein [Desulfatibacillum sp.]
MKWKNFSIGTRLAVGFGVVMILLITVGTISFVGVGGIVDNANQVIEGNRLQSFFSQKELDTINWADHISNLLNDDSITQLDIETDPAKSPVGSWYHSRERNNIETKVPSIAPLLNQLESPLATLHNSAKHIASVYKQPHAGLSQTLNVRLNDHMLWIGKLMQGVAEEAGGMYTYQARVKDSVDIALSLMQACEDNPELGDLQARQSKAMEMIRAIRFGPENRDYIWIQNTENQMVMHPVQPSMDGQNLDAYEDSNGLRFFTEMTQIGQSRGEGFTAYLWPREQGGPALPKVSFVKVFKPWGWIAGSGVYVDNSNPTVVKRAMGIAEGKAFTIDIQTDPTLCGFGKFLADPKTHALAAEIPEFGAILATMKKPHGELHQSAKSMIKHINNLQMEDVIKVYNAQTIPAMDTLKKLFAQAIGVEESFETGQRDASRIFLNETVPSLSQVRALMSAMVKEVRQSMVSEQVMLDEAMTTRRNVVVVSVFAVLAAIFLTLIISRVITNPIKKTLGLAEAVALGDLTQRLHSDAGDEVGELSKALDSMADALEAKAKVAQAIASGELRMDVNLVSDKDVLGNALDRMVHSLNEIVGNVLQGASQVQVSSNQIAEASQSLSQNATEQAASMEEITASMSQIGTQTKTNAENATLANTLAGSARDSGTRGNEQMEIVVEAMTEIERASADIAKINKVIDGIAFQTNLLALNAAVEAARAGKHGKGFAVVAQEVRNLAARSAKAAEETAGLIEGSLKKVERGTSMVLETAETIKEIVEGISKVSDLVGEIAAASNEQAQGVAQINQGLHQIDGATQQNTANAEETAAAAQELNSQANYLKHLLSTFKLKTGANSLGEQTQSRIGASYTRALPAHETGRWGASANKQQQLSLTAPPEKALPWNPEDYN